MSDVSVIELAVCQSTQDEVRDRLDGAAGGTIRAVRTRSQGDGRGREGRVWQDPPGEALLLSVGVQGPLSVDVLADLPRRLGDALLATFDVSGLAWKAPNDLVARDGGAKVAGILVDARTVGAVVEHVIVGIGCNVSGAAFVTTDGREATTLEELGAGERRLEDLADGVVAAIVAELRPVSSA